ncbi:BSD domain-containing protein [Actinidia rufa]|uniref:BSD domain-containing protein n=1 Tax=Actinidia rufa TaxID=165716 RepID=A0A7J0DYX2_9ERIC|nr:BSD domain-containing protein [Actinidia rufa]
MSWLARSIADSLRIDDDDGSEINAARNPKQSQHTEEEEEEEEDDDEDRTGRGVREDLSEFTETLTRQLWGVASFLAPPPPPPPPPPPRQRVHRPIAYRNRWEPSDQSGSGDDSDGGASDSVGISNQSEFPEDPVGEAVGVTEEVLAFAMNIAHHPETWLDFPLEEEDDIDAIAL